MRALINIVFIITIMFTGIQPDKIASGSAKKSGKQFTQDSKINRYVYENKSYKQLVEIRYISEAEIEFKVSTTEKKSGKLTVIKGVARCNIDLDPEIDEDDKGEGYYALQYIYYMGECKLYIRIGLENKDLLKLDSFRCYDFPGRSDGLFSLDVLLKRVK